MIANSLTVVITVYNRVKYLERAVHSTLVVGPALKEVLVIDDGSDQEVSIEIERAMKGLANVKMYRLERNSGVSHARNFGIEKSNTTFICFLDDDDELAPDYHTLACEYLTAHAEIGIVYGRGKLVADSPNSRRFRRLKKYNDLLVDKYHSITIDSPAYFIKYCPPIHTVIFRKSLLDKGAFDEKLDYGEDRWLLMQLMARGLRFYGLDMIGGFYHLHLRSKAKYLEKMAFLKRIGSSGFILHEEDRFDMAKLGFYFSWREGKYHIALIHLPQILFSPRLLVRQIGFLFRVYFG